MLEKNTATTAYSFSVAMGTGDNSQNDKESTGRTNYGEKAKKSLYDVSSEVLANRRMDSQKVVTFYRESDSEKPELRIIIDSRKFLDIEKLIEELRRILNLKDHEKRIYNQKGQALRSIDDFEDGGSYFFSFSVNDNRFMQALSLAPAESKTPRDPKERAKNNWKKFLKQKTRLINVITNENSDNKTPWKVLIDETKLQTFSQLLQELNFIIQPKEGRVFRLCTNKGRRVRGLSEMFHGTDTFVAIVSSVGMLDDSRSNRLDDREMSQISPRKHQLHRPSKYDVITGKGSHLERRSISVKGKLHVFDPPSNHTIDVLKLKNSLKKPEQKLQLDWIYGYNGHCSRDNVFVLQSEELMYYVASVVVIYDIYRQRQRYYAEHTMKINCMALHPNNWYVATGQMAPENFNFEVIDHIRIWNAEMLNTLAILSLEEQTLSVTRLVFSLEDFGRKLASVDSDGHNYRLMVWQWNSKEILAKSQSYEEKELSLKFHPHSNRSLLTAGKDHIFYWNWRGNILEKYKGHFFGCDVPKFVNCVSYASNGEAIAGDSSGNLHFWPEGSRKHRDVINNAHMGEIQALFILSHDVLVTYGTADKLLSLWETRNMQKEPTATMNITGNHGDVTSIAVSPNHHDHSIGNTEIFLGTTKNRILQGTFKTQFKQIVKGHYKETSSLAANPCDNCIVTVGIDGYVIYRSVEENSIIWEKEIEFPATSVAFYPCGNVIAVGMDSGRWCVLHSEDGHHVASFQCGKNELSCISYSAEGGDVAIGTSTGEIYLFSVYDEGHSYRMVASVECHSEMITVIDWSKDGNHLRMLTDNFDQTVLNTEKLAEVDDLQVIADMSWQSQNTTLSYATSGIWRPGSDLRFSSADRSVSRDLLCVGTNYGQIRLFNHPCWDVSANFREYSIHVGSISKLCFLPSELHLVSSGKLDNAIIQWRIAFGKAEEIGARNCYFREHTVEDGSEGWLVRERSSSLGHRRIRGSDTKSTESDPFARPSSVSLKSTRIESIPDDYQNRPYRMNEEEIQYYLHRSGAGFLQKEVALRKSKDFLEDYAVLSPITKEQRKKRRKEGTLPYLPEK